jgi:type IV secretion system protein TrbL
MEFTALTHTLNDCIGIFDGAYARLSPYALALLGALLIIDIALTGSWTAFGMYGPGELVKHFLTLGAWTYVATNFQFLAKTFVTSVIQAGLVGGGMSGADHSLLLDPSKIAGMGLEVTEPVLAALDNLSVFDKGGFGMMFIFGAGYLFLIGCYFAMAIQVFIAVLEYYVILAVVGLLVPFGAWTPTRFLSEKAIGAVVAAGIKLMVLSLVLAASGPILANITKSVAASAAASGGHLTINGLLGSIVAAFGVAILNWKAPSIAAGLLGGSPALSGSDVVRTAAAAGAAAGTLGAAGVAAGSAAVSATKSAVTTGAHVAGAAATGAQLGSATAPGGTFAQLAGGAAGAIRGAGGAALDGVKGAVKRASGVEGVKEAFAEGRQAPLKAGDSPAAPKSSSVNSSAPAMGWSAQAGGYKPESKAADGAPASPIHIGTTPANNTSSPPAPDDDGSSAPPAAAALAESDHGAAAPPSSSPDDGGESGPAGAPALASLPARGEVVSPPAWADQAAEQLRLMADSQKSRRSSLTPSA